MNLLRGLATIPPVALLLVILALPSADAVTIDWVTVGNPGNASDPATGKQYGTVAEQYRIMKFEFTNSQYTAFLNAIDPDGTNPNLVYSSLMGSDGRGGITNTGTTNGGRYAAKPNMGDKPVNFVSWWGAARVCNWLHNGAKTCDKADSSASAPQNTGAYTVGTATSGDAVPANPGALFRVPTANEWYKAAYYDPTLNGNAGGYHVYGNGFDTTPGIISADASGVGSAGGVGNFANYHSKADWNGQDGNVTTVGTNGGPSYYGAFDMTGNVYEWNDVTGAGGPSRGLRGGGWVNSAGPVAASPSNGEFDTAREGNSGGFRLASPVPEPATPGTSKSSPGPEVLENSIGIKLRLLPAGTFTMGRPGGDTDETPHRVTLTKPFYMGVHEVTNAQWKRVMGSVRSTWKGDDHPVEQVSWQDALEFCRKLSALPEERSAGRAYRLPTEAEWEYACRAGTDTTYSFGDDSSQLGEHGWYDGNAGSQTHPVDQKKANAWGLHDMHGNVWELCGDFYGGYPEGVSTDPQGPSGGSDRVRRGGCWGSAAGVCRSTFRGWIDPSYRQNSLGFRLALSPSEGRPVPPEATAEPAPGVLENSIGIQLKLLPAGTFTMGQPGGGPDETPHQVSLTKPFYMGVYEVTNAQWKQVMGSVSEPWWPLGSVPSHWRDDDRPVEKLMWPHAVEFCKRLSALPEERKAGRVYRLPTEAEWEYACRAGTDTRYSFGDNESELGEYAWFEGNAGNETHPVGQKKPNAWGLYDMHGNVWEWCNDFYGAYPEGASKDPQGPSKPSDRVIRGGCWGNTAGYCRSAYRYGYEWHYRHNYLGFRVALSPPEVKPPEADK